MDPENFKQSERYFECDASNYFESGKVIGKSFKEAGLAILESVSVKYTPEIFDLWKSYSKAVLPNIKKYCPVSYETILGMAEEVDLDIILRINTEFEMFVEWRKNNVPMEHLLNAEENKKQVESSGRCTAYAYAGTGSTFSGQTFDDGVLEYSYGKYDKMVRLTNLPEKHGKELLMYTHGLWLSYAGMNGTGLSVTWLFLDTGERDFENGVPSMAIIRELLTMTSLEDAEKYLRSIPHAIPNCFVLAHHDEGILTAECFPKYEGHYTYVAPKSGNHTIHANHVVNDPEKIKIDLNRCETSKERYQVIEKATQKKVILLNDFEELITKDFSTKREGVFVKDDTTVGIIFDSLTKTVHIKFLEFWDKEFQKFSMKC